MLDLNYLAGFAAILVCAACLVGYGRLMGVGLRGPQDRRAFHLTRFIVAMLVTLISRGSWWDLLPVWLGADIWLLWVDVTGGLCFNTLFHLIMLYGGIHGLFALLYFIPEDQRGAWRWWSAWLYPEWRLYRATKGRLKWIRDQIKARGRGR